MGVAFRALTLLFVGSALLLWELGSLCVQAVTLSIWPTVVLPIVGGVIFAAGMIWACKSDRYLFSPEPTEPSAPDPKQPEYPFQRLPPPPPSREQFLDGLFAVVCYSTAVPAVVMTSVLLCACATPFIRDTIYGPASVSFGVVSGKAFGVPSSRHVNVTVSCG